VLTNDVSKTVLSNGLNILTEKMSGGLPLAALGVWTKTGARHDPPHLNGISHFVEHMTFAGTQSRSARQIAIDSDNLGGEPDASTGTESVGFLVSVSDVNLEPGMEILSDMLLNSTYEHSAIEREIGVITEEIKESLDNPGSLADENLMRLMFEDDPLAAPIAGTVESIRNFSTPILREYADSHFTGRNMVLGCVGSLDHDRVVELAERYFGVAPEGFVHPRPNTPAMTSQRALIDKDFEQVHMILGFCAPPRTDSRYFLCQFLSILLGVGISSRLHQTIREEQGLVYGIEANYQPWSNVGLFDIYSITSAEKVERVLELTTQELRKLKEEPPSQEELNRVKRRFRFSQLSTMQRCVDRLDTLVGPFLSHGRMISFQERLDQIDSVTSEDVRQLANSLFVEDRMSLSLVGPLGDTDPQSFALQL
jgi:predicted Zn-dependent peptidase